MNEQPPIPSFLVKQTDQALAQTNIKAVALTRFGEWRAAAAALVEKYRNVAFPVQTSKGYDEAKRALAEVRSPRYAAQNVSKASKTELAEVSRAVGAEEKAVIDYLAETEAHIKEQIETEDKRREAAKAERERIETERVAKHEAGIAKLRGYIIAGAGLSSDKLMRGIEALELMTFDAAAWEEFAERAGAERDTSVVALRRMLADTLASEELLRAAEAQRAENERVAAEHAEERRKLDAERAELAAQRAAQAAIVNAKAEQTAADTKPAATVTSPGGVIANAQTGEVLAMPPAPADAASPPAKPRATGGRRAVTAAHLSLASEVGAAFGRNVGGEWVFSHSQLASAVSHILTQQPQKAAA